MGIRIVLDRRGLIEGDPYRPQVFCDWCGQRIADATDGNYQWEVTYGEPTTVGELFYTHKRCRRAFERANPALPHGLWMAEELRRLPVYLRRNLLGE